MEYGTVVSERKKPLVINQPIHHNSGGSLRLSAANYIGRGTEVALASLLLVAVLPFLMLLAVLIKLDSPGPVLFRQYRLGRGGNLFRFYKLRTMYEDSETILANHLNANPEVAEEWQTYAKLKGSDPRVTRIGGWIRRCSLDEAPQLINVIKGDISLIGPRPYLSSELPAMGEKAEIILSVRPGITGLWQVSGRNDIPFKNRVEMDAWYALNRNWRLDLSIILKTIPAVLSQRGAF